MISTTRIETIDLMMKKHLKLTQDRNQRLLLTNTRKKHALFLVFLNEFKKNWP